MDENDDKATDTQDIGPTPVDGVEESIEEVRAQLATEKAARVAADTAAREAIATANRATGDTHAANLHLVDSTIGRFKNEQETLKAQYRDAMSASNFDAAAEINQAMSDNSAKLLQLENGKAELERAPPREVSRTVTDPVEALASQLTPRSAEWVRRNPQFARDPRLNQKMIGAHNMAVADGFVPDTDAYFAEVESLLKPRSGSVPEVTRSGGEDATAGAATVVARRGAPAAAPVSRTGNAAGVRSGQFTMTPAMRDAARSSGQTDEEYAKNYLALKAEGKIGTGR